MKFASVYQLSSTITVAVAQSTSGTASTSTSAVTTHTVAVGEAGLTYTPNTIEANVADVVEFRFYPQNHSVARAEYKYPCIPYEYTGVNKVGFWSGFQPVNVVLQNPPQFSIVINDTEPIFFYCSAPGACIQDGMIGVINPNSTQLLGVQLAYAENSTLMFSPGQGYPSEITTSTASPTTSPSSSSNSATLSSGAIAGIALGSIALMAITGMLCLLYRRKKKRASQSGNASQGPPSYVPQLQSDYYRAVVSPNSPLGADGISPESYFNVERSLSPLASPDPRQFSPVPQPYPVPQGGQVGTLYGPQELAASEILQPDGTKRSLRPFSFHDLLQNDRDTIANKINNI